MKRHFNLLASVLLVIAMVFALASCDLIDKIIPGKDQPEPEHQHAFVDGSCECGEADPNYVAPHEHNFVEGKCECGETDPNYTKPECAEHAYGAPEVTKEATCTESGSKTLTCTVCGYATELEIAPNGHTEEDIPGKAATCTEAGLSTGSQCTVCGVVTEEQIAINPKGHSFVEGACTVCGEADPEYNGPKTYSFHFSDVVVGADKDAIAAGTTYADGYFTIVGTVTQRVKDGSVYCVEVAKNGTGAIQFIVTGTATVEVQFSSTGGSNTSKIGIFDANGKLVANNEGITEVTGASAGMTVVTYNLTAGTYTVVSPASNVDAGETDYNRGARVYYVNVTETPAEEVSNEIKVQTTDTYCYIDEYSFTANAEGYYTFTLPAGLGFYSKAQFDKYAAPELDFYNNENGDTVVIGLNEGETLVFYVGALTKGNWTITWSFEAGEIEDGPVGPSVTVDTELEVGVNSIYITGGFGATVDCTFAVTEEGTYTFASGNLMAVITMDDGTQLRGQAYLVPGTYNVTIVSYASMDGYYDINVQFAAPVTGEPNGSEEFPYIWDTIPESVTLDYAVVSGKVYYIFTATADGTITFTWPVEGDSWYDIFELDANGNLGQNNTSGFMATSHSFMVEAGKSYRVSLGSWAESGSHTIAISFVSCNHVWSEATCTAPSTCENCGATTGSKAEHTSTVANPTCANPDICAVCEMELSYIPHEFDDGVVTTPADCATGTEGSITYTCTVCGGTQVDTLYAYHEWVVDVENYATCTENGRYEAHCSVCNKVDAYDIEAQGHYNWYATCGDTTTCMECGGEFTLEHAGSEATCTEPMYCYNCWQYVGEPAGHKYDETGLCTECYLTHTLVIAGNSAFFGTEWKLEDENNFLEYDYDNLVFTKSYKCLATGYHQFKVVDVTNGNNWDNCWPSQNFWFYANEGDEVVITFDLKTKNLICTVNGVASNSEFYLVAGDSGLCGEGWKLEAYSNLLTLNADGKYELVYTGVKAGTYGIKVVKNFSWDTQWGSNGDNYMITVEADDSIVTITFDPESGISHAVHAHDYDHVVTAPTCTAGGYTTHTCAFCDYSYTDSETEATGHADDNGDFKCDACSTVVVPEADTVLTIPQAILLGETLATDAYTTNKYYITGIITSVSNTQYGNLYIVDADGNELLIYGTYSADGKTGYSSLSYKPVKGDEVTVYGVVGNYKGGAQMKNGWFDEIVQHTECVWVDATCLEAKHCVYCGKTEGSLADHTFVDGVCSVCEKVEGSSALSNASLSFANKAQRTEFSSTKQVWEQNGVKLTNDKASSTNAVADYANPARFYAGSKITVEGAGMTKIVFTCNSSSYATALKTSIGTVAGATVTVSGSTVTVVFETPVEQFVIAKLSAQVRINSLVVNP